MSSSPVWINGSLVDGETATISAFDHGLTVGDGVFETMKIERATPFALSRHLARLARSAAALGLACPDDTTVRGAIGEVIDANPHAGRLRVTVTGGAAPLGSQRGDAEPTLMVAVGASAAYDETADVVTVDWRRNERGALAGLKTTSYAENVRALAVAHAAGASEAIFANTADQLCEGTGTNVFVVIGDRLLTPPLASGCLAGITRELVLEVTDAIEVDLALDTLANADEAFLTSSTRDVQAIAHVDGKALTAAPGPRTRSAAEAFAALMAADLDP